MEILGWDWIVGHAAWALPSLACTASFLFCGVILASVEDRVLARALGVFWAVIGAWCFSVAAKTFPGVVDTYAFSVATLNFPLLLLPAASLQAAVRLSGHDDDAVSIGVRAAWIATALLSLLQLKQLVFAGFNSYPGGQFAGAGPALPAFIAFSVITVFAGGLAAWLGMTRSRSAGIRLGSRYWLMALGVFIPFGTLNFLVTYGIPLIPMASIGVLLVLGCFAYGIRRDGLFGLEPPTVRLIEFGLATAIAVAPAVAGVGLGMWGGIDLRVGILLVLSIVLGASVVRVFGQPRLLFEASLERFVFPERALARRALRTFFSEVRGYRDSTGLAEAASSLIVDRFGVTGAGLFLKSSEGEFKLIGSNGSLDAAEIVSVEDSNAAIGNSLPEMTTVAVGTPSDAAPRGFLAVGPKHSGGVIDDSDLTLLAMVAAHVGLALELADANSRLAEQEAELIALRKKVDDDVAAIRAEVRVNPKFASIIGESNPIVATLHAVEQAASADIPVLITGETGTGKELIARAVHNLSRRHSGPMIAVNCPAIPVELAEAELFGHERGAFTGANEARPGRFESAHHGTLFLDEVADLPMAVQTKLLRVLQEQESQRLGSEKIHKLDFRVVAATNRDLHEEVARGHFREDLLHRLAGVHIVVPPLRERRSDIPALATYFLERSATDLGKDIAGLSPDALETLVDYSWPGNIRELQNVIDRAVLLCTKRVILAEHLGNLQSDVHAFETFDGNGSLSHLLRDEKIRRVESTLTRTGGNQAAAARILGMSRSNLSRMMKRYGIKANRSAVDLESTGTGDSNRGN